MYTAVRAIAACNLFVHVYVYPAYTVASPAMEHRSTGSPSDFLLEIFLSMSYLIFVSRFVLCSNTPFDLYCFEINVVNVRHTLVVSYCDVTGIYCLLSPVEAISAFIWIVMGLGSILSAHR